MSSTTVTSKVNTMKTSMKSVRVCVTLMAFQPLGLQKKQAKVKTQESFLMNKHINTTINKKNYINTYIKIVFLQTEIILKKITCPFISELLMKMPVFNCDIWKNLLRPT